MAELFSTNDIKRAAQLGTAADRKYAEFIQPLVYTYGLRVLSHENTAFPKNTTLKSVLTGSRNKFELALTLKKTDDPQATAQKVLKAINKFLLATNPRPGDLLSTAGITKFQYDADNSLLTINMKLFAMELAARPKRT
jgi:hypothetical protein